VRENWSAFFKPRSRRVVVCVYQQLALAVTTNVVLCRKAQIDEEELKQKLNAEAKKKEKLFCEFVDAFFSLTWFYVCHFSVSFTLN
jgi:hypothetical protein